MKPRYVKLVYEKWDERLDIEEAIKGNDYSKSYFVDDTTLGRVDYYEPGVGLYKVSYRLVTPPFEQVVTEHFRLYPNVLCEVFTTPFLANEGMTAVQTYLFQPQGKLESRYELQYDREGRIVRRIKLGEGGERLNHRA